MSRSDQIQNCQTRPYHSDKTNSCFNRIKDFFLISALRLFTSSERQSIFLRSIRTMSLSSISSVITSETGRLLSGGSSPIFRLLVQVPSNGTLIQSFLGLICTVTATYKSKGNSLKITFTFVMMSRFSTKIREPL